MIYEADTARTPTDAIVHALATATDTEPTELTPLYDSIDTEALNQMFGEHGGARDAKAVLGFQVENWNVFVRGDGRIRVCDATRQTDPEPVFQGKPA
ncbi:HalOD1 output domain-containing protein [Haloarcula rara]|uniref:HalOD1 output domain-containing protein n=1 Tax=Haloarcula rara TaxID=3033387 RepID=UPI0023E82718|nr:HalOD1 output domain-containing protein [Halomicroarcula sp. SHR3]